MSDSLAIWAYAVNGKLVGLDFGEVPACSSGDVMIRVKNQSPRYTAHDVTLQFQPHPDLGWHFYLSDDGVNFAATLDLGELAPNALTGAIWIRRVTPSDTDLGAKQTRLSATVAAWSQPTS